MSLKGRWKSLLHLHDERSPRGCPVHAPEDTAVSATGVPAEPAGELAAS